MIKRILLAVGFTFVAVSSLVHMSTITDKINPRLYRIAITSYIIGAWLIVGAILIP